MWSFIWLTGFLCLSTCYARSDTLKKKYSYSSDYEIILDEQSVQDNSLVYSACTVGEFRKGMNCSITLQSFPDAKAIDELTCQSNYAVADENRNITKHFQLKKLFKNFVAFVWSDEDEIDLDEKHLVLSIINMDKCEMKNYDFKSQIEQFHIVVYEQTFDVYYPERQCGHFLCGETFDWRGELLNGPAVSYLPNEYFYNNTRMCSVKADASSKGHFVITPNTFNLVSAYYGKRIEMGALPFDARVATYDCSKEYLGYCWLSHTKRIINCEQFNTAGKVILSTAENLNYEPGTWMSMKNLGANELLIINNECSGMDSCTGNTEKIKFHVLKKPADKDKAVDAYQLSGLECNHANIVRSQVIQKEDGRICVTLVCHAGTSIPPKSDNLRHKDTVIEKASQSINLLSTCFLK